MNTDPLVSLLPDSVNMSIHTEHCDFEKCCEIGGPLTEHGTVPKFSTYVDIKDNKTGWHYDGISICHPRDTPNKKIGRRIAFERALEMYRQSQKNVYVMFGGLEVGDLFEFESFCGVSRFVKIESGYNDVSWNCFCYDGTFRGKYDGMPLDVIVKRIAVPKRSTLDDEFLLQKGK